MRTIAIGVVGLAALVASIGFPALGADMAVKALSPAPAAAPTNWTGFYVGGNAGYGWSDPSVSFTPNDVTAFGATCGGSFGSTCAPPASFNISGALGGLQAGYNWQFNQSWLLGVETDFDWSRIQGTGTSNFLMVPVVAPPGTASFQASENANWFGTVRGRIGYLPTNNLLVYGTAGFAYGRVKENVSLNGPAGANLNNFPFGFLCVAGPNCFVGSSSSTTLGWTAGTGLEYALTNHISVKAEYLYVSLGSNSVRVVAVTPAGPGFTPTSFTANYSATSFNVIRGGVSYRF